MPIDPVTGALIAGTVINAAGSFMNRSATKKNNEAQRQHEREMYAQERADNRTDWATQNAYNHPLEQIRRLTDAGLSPQLMYGHGSSGNVAGGISAASPKVSRSDAPQLDTGFSSMLMDGAIRQQQFNINQQVAQADIDLKRAQAASALTGASLKERDLSVRDQMNDAKLNLLATQAKSNWYNQLLTVTRTENETAKYELIKAQTENIMTNTQVSKVMMQPNKEKALAETARIIADTNFFGTRRQQAIAFINSSQYDSIRKEYENAMMKSGVSQNSPWYVKLFGTTIKNAMEEILNTNTTPFEPIPLIK